MKKVAIRGVSGIWVYYVAQLTYEEVDYLVNSDGNELHQSKKLSDLIQRSLTNNVDNIKNYILNQKERFFNSLVLAVYDGKPEWEDFELKDKETGEEIYNFGFLCFDKDVKIFAVDGQHRVHGIREALKNANNEQKEILKNDTIPVIFIAHGCDENGVKRTRRLFTTLNKYAKPVSDKDIIALDEDDIYAISTRYVIDNCVLFSDGRIDLESAGKKMQNNDQQNFTNIITLFECNKELVNLYLTLNEVYYNGKRVIGKEYLKQVNKFRLNDDDINAINTYLKDFWDKLSKKEPFVSYLAIDLSAIDKPASVWRNNENGGNALFRPVFLPSFIESLCKRICGGVSIDDAIEEYFSFDLDCSSELWSILLWNSNKHRVERPSKKAIINTFSYLLGEEVNEKGINAILESCQKINSGYSKDSLLNLLNNYKK